MPNAVLAARRASRAFAALLLASTSLIVPASRDPALAQGSEWQPFRDRDERLRNRPPLPLPPTLPTIDRGDINRTGPGAMPQIGAIEPVPGTAGQPVFRPATVEPGNVRIERIELPPMPGQSATAPENPLPGFSAMPAAPRSADIGKPSPQVRRDAVRPMPNDVWRGIDMRQIESLVGPLELPPKSAALHSLWGRLMSADAAPPAGGAGPNHFLALQLEALYRSGLTGAMSERLARAVATPDDPLILTFAIRLALADGDTATACDNTRRLAAKRGALPKMLKGEMHVLAGYCAATQGNTGGAGLAADLAREDEVEAPFALLVLDAIGTGQKGARVTYPPRLPVLEYRLLEVLGSVDPQGVLASAEPALLNAIANADNADPRLTIAAAEAAAGMHALAPEGLAEVYGALVLPANAGADPFFRRAAWFKSLANEPDPARKLQIARQLIDDARKSGFGFAMARALAAPLSGIRSGGETGPLSIVAVETAIASGDFARARSLATAQPEAQAWLALVDIADPRAQGVSDGALAAVDGLARQGRFDAVALHRLATVLDALDVNVPIPLWEAASRTSVPNTGHLPETGLLPQLGEAARRGEVGKTSLLVMRTIGPGGPAAAHLIALGDSLRALRRVGLEADARALALEALYADWPRGR